MPQERCVQRCAVHSRLWNVGEVRTIHDFDEDGKPIVTDHFRLVEDDESIDENMVFDESERKEKQREIGQRDKTAAVLKALEALDPSEDRDWTKDGLPSMQQVCLKADLDLTRAEIQSIAPDFDRDQHRANQQAVAASAGRASA